jgi:ABC-2 type transport system permease protein
LVFGVIFDVFICGEEVDMSNVFSGLKREVLFACKQKTLLGLWLATFMLSSFAVWTGLAEVSQQQRTISALLIADKKERESVLAEHSDFGSAAYYTFHLTYSSPSNLAFAALGERDTYPWKHRVRMLALEGQIYETDTPNPELAQAGRVDFAFVLSFLIPLIIILLLYDVQASERKANRFDLLVATATQPGQLWLLRVLVRILILVLCLLIPFWVAASVSGTGFSTILMVSLISIIYVAFWTALCTWVMRKDHEPPRLASTLIGIWLLLSAIIPVGGHLLIKQSVEGPRGGDVVLLQREAVNDAWDIPKQKTMSDFVAAHPEWKDNVEMESQFEWKWYYAMQQVGDMKASELSHDYRDAIRLRDKFAGFVSLISPPMLVQRQLTQLAETNAQAALKYEQQVRDYHAKLRLFYYPLLFDGQEFSIDSFNNLPEF